MPSHPARGAWIEIATITVNVDSGASSHPARGAWIEIPRVSAVIGATCVAPRKGCVD